MGGLYEHCDPSAGCGARSDAGNGKSITFADQMHGGMSGSADRHYQDRAQIDRRKRTNKTVRHQWHDDQRSGGQDQAITNLVLGHLRADKTMQALAIGERQGQDDAEGNGQGRGA